MPTPTLPHLDVSLPPGPEPVPLAVEEPQIPQESTDSDLAELNATLAVLQNMGLLNLNHPEPPTEVPKKVVPMDMMRQSTLEELPAVVWTPRVTAGGNNEVSEAKDSVAVDPTSEELPRTRSPHKDLGSVFVSKVFVFFNQDLQV